MSISRSSVLRVALALGLLAAAGVSLAATVFEGVDSRGCPDCPDWGVKTQKSSSTYGPTTTCGTVINVNQGPLTLRGPTDLCPTFVIVYPERDVTTPKPKFKFKLDAMVPVIEYRYSCATRWNWFLFIPIPFGSYCRLDGSKTLYSLPSYTEHKCDEESPTAGVK